MDDLVHKGEEIKECPNLFFDGHFLDGVCCCLTKSQVRYFEKERNGRSGSEATPQ